jgi:NDP-sugar pyrophosphorylase family protein
LPVCDIPILRYGIANLVAHGIRDIVINLHHRGDLIEREIGDGSGLGASVEYSREEQLLGTGGGLKRALPLLDPFGRDEPFLSLNGKLIFDLDLSAVLAAHRDDPGTLGTMVVRPVPDAEAWGAVDVRSLASQGGPPLRVQNILGRGEWMFCGIHVTRPSVIARLPDGEACMIRQGYLPWIRSGGQVGAYIADPNLYFAEHSTPERYLLSNLALLAEASLRYPPGLLHGVEASAHLHPTARLRHPVKIGAGAHVAEGVELGPGVVVGAHAIVESNARLTEVVVWPHARCDGNIRSAIVHGDNHIVPC